MSKSHLPNLRKAVYDISSTREAIGKLLEIVDDTLKKMEIPIDSSKLGLVLSEGLSNALLHGNFNIPVSLRNTKGEDAFWRLVDQREQDETYSRKKIVLRLECLEDSLKFEVIDEGNGFDWKRYMNSISSEDFRRSEVLDKLNTHGRGLSIILSHAVLVAWNQKGNEIRFSVKLSPKQGKG